MTDNDLMNRELSVDELDAIAACGIFGDIWHGIEHAASATWHWIEGPGLKYATEIVKWIEQHPPTGPGPTHKAP